MTRALFVRSLRSVVLVMAILVVIAGAYIASVVYLYDPAVSESLAVMQAAMPELFAAFGMANAASTLLDFLINYLYGFLFTALLIVLAVYLSNKLVASPLKDGSFAWVLATPCSRRSIIFTFIVVEAVAVALVVALCWMSEVAFCEAWFPGELDQRGLACVNGGLFVLGFFIVSVCFAATILFRNASLGLGIGAGVCALFFLMGLAGSVGEGLAWVADLSPYRLFDPYSLAAGSVDAFANVALLCGAAIGLNALTVIVFMRRDFSL